MTLRRGHGKGAGTPRVEVLPPVELPDGLPALQPAARAMPRPPYAAGSAEAREAGRRGGTAKQGRTALAAGVGLEDTFADPSFQRYRSAAENFARLHISRLAATVGGGDCGPAPASIVWSAGLQLAASRWAFEVRGDHALGSKLANDSRQNLLAAHELCAREAEARKRTHPNGAHRSLAALLAGDDRAPARDRGAVARSDRGTIERTTDEQNAPARRVEAAMEPNDGRSRDR
jgi:hypothetical protein